MRHIKFLSLLFIFYALCIPSKAMEPTKNPVGDNRDSYPLAVHAAKDLNTIEIKEPWNGAFTQKEKDRIDDDLKQNIDSKKGLFVKLLKDIDRAAKDLASEDKKEEPKKHQKEIEQLSKLRDKIYELLKSNILILQYLNTTNLNPSAKANTKIYFLSKGQKALDEYKETAGKIDNQKDKTELKTLFTETSAVTIKEFMNAITRYNAIQTEGSNNLSMGRFIEEIAESKNLTEKEFTSFAEACAKKRGYDSEEVDWQGNDFLGKKKPNLGEPYEFYHTEPKAIYYLLDEYIDAEELASLERDLGNLKSFEKILEAGKPTKEESTEKLEAPLSKRVLQDNLAGIPSEKKQSGVDEVATPEQFVIMHSRLKVCDGCKPFIAFFKNFLAEKANMYYIKGWE